MEDEDVEGTPGSSGSRPAAGRDGEEVSAISSFKGSEMCWPGTGRAWSTFHVLVFHLVPPP